MSGPPRAGHIWTDPGAWFFHLQFYKKYVIIFKKGKISHENFFAWAFYRKGSVYNNRMEIRLTFEILFWQSQAKFFWKLRTKIFLKVASKISLENFRCCQVRIFYHERGVHYKRTEIRLTLEGLFWKCGGHFFWEVKLASKILDFFRNDNFIERGLFITRERKLDLFLRYFF